MGKITFILGGARSGKSTFALELAKKSGLKVAFIATCEGLDPEMKERIKLHRQSRPKKWKTYEEPKKVYDIVDGIKTKFDCLIIDCLTLLVSNLFLSRTSEKSIEQQVKNIVECVKKSQLKTIIVSNEIGLGIVPDNALGRKFRDIAGRINQIVAKEADELFFMVASIPLKVKRK